MARRASKSLNPVWLASTVLLVAAGIGGGFYFFGQKGDPYRAIETLNPRDILENANSLRGNVYKIECTVQTLLEWDPNYGKVISVEVTQDGVVYPLPIYFPQKLNEVNVQKGQKIHIKLRVDRGGVLVAEEVDKT